MFAHLFSTTQIGIFLAAATYAAVGLALGINMAASENHAELIRRQP